MIGDTIGKLVSLSADDKIRCEDWDIKGLSERMNQVFPINLSYHSLEGVGKPEEIKGIIFQKVEEAYARKEARLTGELMRELERRMLLHTLDSEWKEHLYSMDLLKEGIGLRGYGQRDPLIEYKREAYDMFEGLIGGLKEEVSKLIFRVEIAKAPFLERVLVGEPQMPQGTLGRISQSGGSNDFGQAEMKIPTHRRSGPRVGRNDPCTCGSGKKYKYCCGRKQ